MKFLRSLAKFVCFAILVAGVFISGIRVGVATIQQSCDNMNESRTVINGHAYFCGDYDAVSRAFAVLQQRGGA